MTPSTSPTRNTSLYPLIMHSFNKCSLMFTIVQEQERAENELVPLLWAIPGNLVFLTPIGYSHSICSSFLLHRGKDTSWFLSLQMASSSTTDTSSWAQLVLYNPRQAGLCQSPDGS